MHAFPTSSPAESRPRRGRRRRSRVTTFATNLRSWRVRRGLNQGELAERLEVSEDLLARWERDLAAPALEEVPRIAVTLGVSTDALLGSAAEADLPWQRLVYDLLAHYPGRIEIKEINLWAPNQAANLSTAPPPDPPGV